MFGNEWPNEILSVARAQLLDSGRRKESGGGSGLLMNRLLREGFRDIVDIYLGLSSKRAGLWFVVVQGWWVMRREEIGVVSSRDSTVRCGKGSQIGRCWCSRGVHINGGRLALS